MVLTERDIEVGLRALMMPWLKNCQKIVKQVGFFARELGPLVRGADPRRPHAMGQTLDWGAFGVGNAREGERETLGTL